MLKKRILALAVSLSLLLVPVNISNAEIIFQTVHSNYTQKTILTEEDEANIRAGIQSRAKYLEISSEQSSAIRDKIVELAKKQKGKPYVWGAIGPTAFDCSGFVNWLYKNSGKPLNCRRCTTYSYPSMSKSVSREEALPGDILLRRDHVLVYIGNNKVVHARSEAYGVVEESVDEVLRRSPELTFRRLLND